MTTEDYPYVYTYYDDNDTDSNASLPEFPNFWCSLDPQQKRIIKTFQTCAFCLIFLLGVTGNSLVIATFALYRRLRLRSTTDIFLFHLALADLLLLLTLPLKVADTNLSWSFSESFQKSARAFHAVNTYSGLLLLACISVDRYMVVVRAQEMLRLRHQMHTVGSLAAVGVWFVAVLLSLPEILFAWHYNHDCHSCNEVKMASMGLLIAVFCLTLLTMLACYSVIARVLCESPRHRRGKQWQRQRTLKLMVALVLVFLAFQLPYTVVLFWKMARPICELMLEYSTCTLAYTRCCLNPVLYALIGVRFRRDVWHLLQDAGCACAPGGLLQTLSSVSSPNRSTVAGFSPVSPSNSSSNAVPSNFSFQEPHKCSR
ncbi:C-X-C chemokine receptor type 6-like [Oryzias latipes]|uniref:Chemokine (C-C motif) receptor 10 n=1 Tax=Oryzias latipes TaxID=8090 RepID=H2MG79_ORYLA|nr:C-X-C chemokine receptor type 6-like [Oryzias latipes]